MPGQARNKRLWINTGLLVLSAAGILAIVLLTMRTAQIEHDERVVVAETTDTLMQLRNVVTDTLSAETGQRGYILTLDRRYLESYYAGRDRIRPTLRRLRGLIGEDSPPRQVEMLDRVEVLARAKFAEMEQTVELVQAAEVAEAQRLVLTDEGKETMDRLRRAVREMEAIEASQLRDASDQAAAAESRVLPLLSAVIALLAVAFLAGIRVITRTAQAEAEAAQAPIIAEARDRADLLARELNHRVKNLFAVILAIVKLSLRGRPEAQDFGDSVVQRIQALLKAHDVSQGELAAPSVSLAALIETSLAPYRSDDLAASLEGPEVILGARTITPLGLALHELTTNAVKYGGWSRPGGRIDVRWVEEEGTIHLVWQESGVPVTEQPTRQGFGSQLMTSTARQLGGSIEREFAPDGAVVTIRFPSGDPAI